MSNAKNGRFGVFRNRIMYATEQTGLFIIGIQ